MQLYLKFYSSRYHLDGFNDCDLFEMVQNMKNHKFLQPHKIKGRQSVKNTYPSVFTGSMISHFVHVAGVAAAVTVEKMKQRKSQKEEWLFVQTRQNDCHSSYVSVCGRSEYYAYVSVSTPTGLLVQIMH